jgi:uncharacterized membrane protein
MGELAALGLVLAIRLAGDSSRPQRLRTGAAAATAPLGMGLYLSFSRGALFACVAGLVTLVVVAPTRAQLRILAMTVCVAAVAAVASAPFSGVTSLAGGLGTRERQGAIVLVLLAVIMAVAAMLARRLIRDEPAGRVRLPRLAPLIGCATGRLTRVPRTRIRCRCRRRPNWA